MDKLELSYFESMLGFTVWDSGVKPATLSTEEPRYASIEEFFSEEHSRMARLLYIETTQIAGRRDQAIQNGITPDMIYTDVEDLDRLRKMKAGELYIVTNPMLMRGIDYRSEDGIVLMIDRLFDSARAAK